MEVAGGEKDAAHSRAPKLAVLAGQMPTWEDTRKAAQERSRGNSRQIRPSLLLFYQATFFPILNRQERPQAYA